MDILTHAGIGLVAAAPFVGSQPELAAGLAAGSVLPDLDALSRMFGKRAYLLTHQTWTHAIPVEAAFSVAAGLLASAFGAGGVSLGVGLFAGLAVHTLLDFSNTLGVALLGPFSRKRFCLEWVFFIDAVVAVWTIVSAGFAFWTLRRWGEMPVRYAGVCFVNLAAYFALKAILRRRAGSFAPEAVSLVPSALCLWRFFGVARDGGRVRTFAINAVTGERSGSTWHDIFDDTYCPRLAAVPEFKLMRGLSPAYHVVSARKTDEGDLVLCRDLRTRNFSTRFGDLEVLLGPDNKVKRTLFHV